jgi:hypothetical protein
MENTKKQKGLDPDAGTCFLDPRTEERSDYPIPNIERNETVTNQFLSSEAQPNFLTGQVIDAKNALQSFHTRPSDVTRSEPGGTNHRNPTTTDSRNQSDPILPSGEIIDSKNTLQSFQSTNSTNTKSKSNNVATHTVQPLGQNFALNDPPTKPSGEVIDSKNPLQSFNACNTRSAAKIALPGMNVRPNNICTSENPTEDSTSVRLPQSHAPNVDAQAENVYIAELVTNTPRRKAIFLSMLGILAIVAAVLIAGACFSGKCGSKDNGKNLSTETKSPTIQPTASPTAAPTGIDVVVEGVVSAFVNNISYFGQEIFVNGTNAESAALKWIIQEDPLFANDRSGLLTINSLSDNEVSFRVRQRFPLVTFWFQQMDEEGDFVKTWSNIVGWLGKSECEWYGIDCVNRSVTGISFYNSATKVANNYAGSIPPDIGLLTSLQVFSMYDNDVTGTIPESIGRCSQMKQFDIARGSVKGTLPSSLGQWTDVYYIDVSENEIIGTFPESADSWTNITYISLAQNQLSGSIPSFIGQWSSIKVLYFSVNKFAGSIPDEVGNLGNISFFDLGMNLLTGSLPSSIGFLTSTVYFFVNENRLTGTIPPSIGNWSRIQQAFFEMNDFTGELPPEICPSIQVGDLLSCDCQVNCSCCTKSCTP